MELEGGRNALHEPTVPTEWMDGGALMTDDMWFLLCNCDNSDGVICGTHSMTNMDAFNRAMLEPELNYHNTYKV